MYVDYVVRFSSVHTNQESTALVPRPKYQSDRSEAKRVTATHNNDGPWRQARGAHGTTSRPLLAFSKQKPLTRPHAQETKNQKCPLPLPSLLPFPSAPLPPLPSSPCSSSSLNSRSSTALSRIGRRHNQDTAVRMQVQQYPATSLCLRTVKPAPEPHQNISCFFPTHACARARTHASSTQKANQQENLKSRK